MKTACTIALIMGISLNMYAQNKEEQSSKQFASFNALLGNPLNFNHLDTPQYFRHFFLFYP